MLPKTKNNNDLVHLFKLYCGSTFGFDYLESDYRQKAATDYRAVLLITGCSDYNAAVDKICSYVKKMAEVL